MTLDLHGKMKNRVYLDYNATTPYDEDLVKKLPEFLGAWGNASSIHWAGRFPKTLIREARQSLATGLGAQPLELIFTSGASEANTMIIRGIYEHFLSQGRQKFHFVVSSVEHPSVTKTFNYLESLGCEVTWIPVSREGFLDLELYKSSLRKGETLLVSCMFANNETGTLFPIADMVHLAHDAGALFHCDMVQALGKATFNLKDLMVDYASFSAHKFYAFKGCGLAYVRKGKPQFPLIFGGAQERSRRGGTENNLGIMAFGFMMSKLHLASSEIERLSKLRNHLEQRIIGEISDVNVTAGQGPRICNTSSLVILGVDGETLLMSLDLKGFAVSTGAACSSGSPEPSPVLLALGLSRAEAQSSLRLSLGWGTTAEEVDSFVETLKNVVNHLRQISQGVKL